MSKKCFRFTYITKECSQALQGYYSIAWGIEDKELRKEARKFLKELIKRYKEKIPYDLPEVVKDYRSARTILAVFADYLEDLDDEQWRKGEKWKKRGSWLEFLKELEHHLVAFGKDEWGWNYLDIPVGGIAGFWWRLKPLECGDDKFWLYLQLEVNLDDPDAKKLCFKLEPMGPDDYFGKRLRDYCTTHILDAGSELVCKPNRMSAGSSMTIAQWDDKEGQNPWLVSKLWGGVNIKKTVENLMEAQRILDKAAKAIRKEQAK